jgi:hypothetical protein
MAFLFRGRVLNCVTALEADPKKSVMLTYAPPPLDQQLLRRVNNYFNADPEDLFIVGLPFNKNNTKIAT